MDRDIYKKKGVSSTVEQAIRQQANVAICISVYNRAQIYIILCKTKQGRKGSLPANQILSYPLRDS